MKRLIFAVMVFLATQLMLISLASAIEQTSTGFYWPIGISNFDSKCGIWLGRDEHNGGCYFENSYHNGVDMMAYDDDI